MLFFGKKTVDDEIIQGLSNLLDEYEDEFNKCFIPKDAFVTLYLGGSDLLDNQINKELREFNFHELNYKNKNLSDILNENSKMRKSFFVALNNIKQNQNLFYNNALLDFLKENGRIFLTNYLDRFKKEAKAYNKQLQKGKLKDGRYVFVWIEDEKLYFLDNLFVYITPLAIDIQNITSYYEEDNETFAGTVIEYTDNEEIKKLKFNLASFEMLKKLIPFKAENKK
ncbi:hypothetical protein JOC70_001745 [Clostridium pascui]|uniref:hypothetical protein n=1 Tax=Clostridium pascui TaxID=46609 RepID=UPI00195E5864|nr:hypothetical protein [Clostridium pascui]MBM7870275.1 hypothetical protein [Clostridium pascui]